MDLQTKINFLRSLRIFEDFTEDEAFDLAGIARAYDFTAGSVIAYQRDVVNALYIVQSGRLEAFEVDDSGVVVAQSRYMPGDYFDDIWLFTDDVHSTTVRAVSDGRLFLIDGERFLDFIDKHPGVTLDMSDEAWDEVNRSLFSAEKNNYSRFKLGPGELVEFESRRSAYLLAYQLFLPVLVALLLPTFVAVLMRLTMPESITNSWVGIILPMIFFLPPALFAIYRYFDWSNDYFLVTNESLIHQEFNLGTFSGNITKLPLDQVQSVNALRPSFIQTMLGVGTIEVTTGAAKSRLRFDNIPDPVSIENVIADMKRRGTRIEASRNRAEVRRTLEEWFKVPDQISAVESDPQPQNTVPSRRKKPRFSLRTYRFDEGGTITYRRHIIVLLRQSWYAIIALMLVAIGIPLILYLFPLLRVPLTYTVSVSLLLLVLLLCYYLYEDWANDIFQVTERAVIDIDRGPFGFTESRKTAELVNVQNVEADRPSFWATIFGYGNVTIDTAGASNDIVFENVSNPNQVQADIFQRREAVRRGQQRRDAVRRREEFALLLDEYQQLREQDKIPERTPDRRLGVDETGDHYWRSRPIDEDPII